MAKVVIVGGGMAGAACAIELGRRQAEVLLVDRNNYSQFQPLLYQVASSQLPAEDIARPLRGVVADYPSVTVVQSDVTDIDARAKKVSTADGPIAAADYLVVAAGAQPNFFGVPGAGEHSFPLYSVSDAERLRVHLRDRLKAHLRRTSPTSGPPFEPASPTEQPATAEPLTVVVVGGGPTGVETAGAISELFTALREDGRLDDTAQVHLVDHGKALLAPFTEQSHAYALRKLTDHGVKVRFGVAITQVGPEAVQLSDGSTLDTRTVIWGGGERAASLVAGSGMPVGRGGRIDVAADLAVPGFPGVFAVGDVANIPGPHGHPHPQLGSVAQQSGKWAATNILAEVDGSSGKPFHYRDKGIMAMIGRNCAVAEIGAHRHQVEGPIAFAAWLGVHAILLSGVHSRVDAFLNWADDYFHHDRAADLEVEGTPTRIAWADDPADRPVI